VALTLELTEEYAARTDVVSDLSEREQNSGPMPSVGEIERVDNRILGIEGTFEPEFGFLALRPAARFCGPIQPRLQLLGDT
jgi:hypothetical protein